MTPPPGPSANTASIPEIQTGSHVQHRPGHSATVEPGAARPTGQPDAAHNVLSLKSLVGPSYFPIALIARFPYAMMVVGVLTLVVAARDSLGLGGLTSAMVGLGTALCGPLIGAAADRWGQRLVLSAAGGVSSVFLLLLAWTAYSGLGSWAVLLAAFFIGASAPQIPPMSRSRLLGLMIRYLPAQHRQRTINKTMAYESAVDEVTFVFGPLIVGILAAFLGPAAPMIGAAVLTILFVTAFARHPTATAAPRETSQEVAVAALSELFRIRLLVVIAGALGVGLLFGSTLTTLTAVMNEAGQAERAGLIYSAMGVGSAVFALLAGMLPPRFLLRERWLAFSALILLGSAGLLVAQSPASLLIALLILGIGIGPTLVTVFSLVAQQSPQGRSATAMSLATTAIVVGQSTASAFTGQIAEHYTAAAAAWLPVVAAMMILTAATTNWRITARDIPVRRH